MIRLTKETDIDTILRVKVGDMVTDGFSKTGQVVSIEVKDDGLFRYYSFHLATDRVIMLKR